MPLCPGFTQVSGIELKLALPTFPSYVSTQAPELHLKSLDGLAVALKLFSRAIAFSQAPWNPTGELSMDKMIGQRQGLVSPAVTSLRICFSGCCSFLSKPL